MSFVLVQHLEPYHKSILAEILSRETSLNIQYAKNNVQVKPGNVYVIPPNSYLSISHRTLKITPRTRHPDGQYLPIDFFMVSLSVNHGKKAVGVVLSGTGSDGTSGIKAIKEKGGIAFAQDEKTAKYYSMPASAIASGSVDFILEPEAIAAKLIEIAAHKHEIVLTKKEPRINKEAALDRILFLLRDLSGLDFAHYKRTTVERRIMRRMDFHRIKSTIDYYNYLQRNPAEAQALYKDMLIPVTMFFRDPKIFMIIEQKILPRIIKNRHPEDIIRAWVPACSTGEEVYSIAMTIYEFLENNKIKPGFQIFGTDLSDANIEKARLASYGEDIAEHVSTVRLRRFFTRTETGYKIAKHIREMCIFAKQDITNDPPLSNMDIISCRNLLIYLDTVLQNKVLSVLYYALKPRGFLVLGTAESLTSMSGLFTAINKKYKIYSKNITGKRAVLGSVMAALKPKPVEVKGARAAKKASAASGTGKAVSDKYAPKTVTEKNRAPEAAKSGKGKPEYAKQDSNKLERELVETKKRLNAIIQEKDTFNEELKAANEEIQSSNEELQSTNEELETSKEELQSTNEELLTINDEMQNKNAELTQLNNDLTNVFSSINIPLIIVNTNLNIMRFTPAARKVMNLIPTDVGRPISDIKLNINVPGLEKTILDVIETMTPAEFEVRDEAERWYSVRIRPYKTIDNKIDGAVISMIDIDVMKRAQNEIKDALDYADSIIETIREPLLVMDNNLRILSANKSFYRMFMVSAQDIENKFIYEICGSKWNLPELRKALAATLRKKAHFENLEVMIDFAKIGMKVLSLNARPIYLQGKEREMILLAIEDVTQRKKAEEVLKRDKESMERLVKQHTDDLMSAHAELQSAKRLSDVGTLAATVAHELRNPLAAIAMAVNNIKRKADNHNFDKHLANIEKKILESDQIINNLLFYSHIKPPHYKNVNLFDLIKEALDGIKQTRKTNVSIIRNIDSLKEISIESDPIHIKEIIDNLLNNACDALPSAGGKIEVAGVHGDEFVRITIKDNGCGIDKAVMDKIFDPFFTTKAKGTGLGLSVCKQIVNMYDGKICVKSELGKGTSISVLLPKKK